MHVGGLSVSQTARPGQTPSGTLTRVEARRTKEWAHQGWTAGGEWRPQQMARLMRTGSMKIEIKRYLGYQYLYLTKQTLI